MRWLLIVWILNSQGEVVETHRSLWATIAQCDLAGGRQSVSWGAVRWRCEPAPNTVGERE